jgi:hypothetical protein
MSVRRISSCLDPSLLALSNHVENLAKMEIQLQSYLPEALRLVCFVSSFKQGSLTIGVADAVWVTPLRYELPTLRDRLRREGGLHGLTSIQLKVQPFVYEFKKIEKNPVLRSLSQAAREALKEMSHLLHNDPVLSDIASKDKDIE